MLPQLVTEQNDGYLKKLIKNASLFRFYEITFRAIYVNEKKIYFSHYVYIIMI